MRSRPWLVLALLWLLISPLAAFACGGGDNEQAPPDLGRIPTATLPNPLPEPLIVSGPSSAPGGTTYAVQPNDSLSAIAAQFGTTVEAIAQANGIEDPTSLFVGQELVIPGAVPDREVAGATAPPSTPMPQVPEAENVYIVQEGDIPETIAAQFGITAEALMAANGITDPASLFIGQELLIPSPESAP